MSAGRAEELAAEARRAEEAVKAARAKKKEADGTVKRLHARGKQLQVGCFTINVFVASAAVYTYVRPVKKCARGTDCCTFYVLVFPSLRIC